MSLASVNAALSAASPVRVARHTYEVYRTNEGYGYRVYYQGILVLQTATLWNTARQVAWVAEEYCKRLAK